MPPTIDEFLQSMTEVDPSLAVYKSTSDDDQILRISQRKMKEEVERRGKELANVKGGSQQNNDEVRKLNIQLQTLTRAKEEQKRAMDGALTAAETKLKELVEKLTEIGDTASPLASVLSVSEKKCVILLGALKVEVNRPSEKEISEALKPGVTVRVFAQTNQILSVVEDKKAPGDVQKVLKVIDDASIEVEHPGGSRAVVWSGEKPEEGDRVVLDLSNMVALRNIGPKETDQVFTGDTLVSWDDIGGLVEAKRAMREALEEPHLQKELYAEFNKKPCAGILLSGPPGNGKTLLGKAAATSMATIHGASAKETGYIYVKGPELLSKWVGQSEGNIRTIFDSARLHKKKHGYPAVVFIDEADAVLGRRGGRPGGLEGMERTIVPMFLAEMDGLEPSGCFVILATNRPDSLDPAVVRDGRIDRKIQIMRPGQEDAIEIFKRHVRGKPLVVNEDKFCQAAAKSVFDEMFALYDVKLDDGVHKFTLAHLLSGAMCAGIVESATQFAIRRRLTGAKLSKDQKGIMMADLVNAVADTHAQQRVLNHQDEIAEFCERFKSTKVHSVTRA